MRRRRPPPLLLLLLRLLRLCVSSRRSRRSALPGLLASLHGLCTLAAAVSRCRNRCPILPCRCCCGGCLRCLLFLAAPLQLGIQRLFCRSSWPQQGGVCFS